MSEMRNLWLLLACGWTLLLLAIAVTLSGLPDDEEQKGRAGLRQRPDMREGPRRRVEEHDAMAGQDQIEAGLGGP